MKATAASYIGLLLFLQSNLVANFNLPASYSWVLTLSLKIAAGFISTLSSGEREESEATTGNKGHVLDLSERYHRYHRPAELPRSVSTALEADLVHDHRWRMSRDGVWSDTAASIFTLRQTDRPPQTLASLCFILKRSKLLCCWLSARCCSGIIIYPSRWNAPHCSQITHILLM